MNATTAAGRWTQILGEYDSEASALRLSTPLHGAAKGKWVSVPRTLEIMEILDVRDDGLSIDVKRRAAAVVERFVDGAWRLYAVPWAGLPDGLTSDTLLDHDWLMLDPCLAAVKP